MPKYFIFYIPLIGIILLFTLANASHSLGWSSFPYDEWRLLEIFILASMPFFSFSSSKNIYPPTNDMLLLGILFILTVTYIIFREASLNQITMLCIYNLLLYALTNLTNVFRNLNLNFFLCYLTLIPIFTVIWLPIESVLLITHPDIATSSAWLASFVNPRQYDDMILPVTFLLFSLTLFKKKPALMIAIGSLYLWGSFSNGARGVLLSIMIGILITIFIQKKYTWAIPIFISIMIAFFFNSISPSKPTIVRFTSSGRIYIWEKALENWLHYPVFGRPVQNEYSSVLHTHNFFLELLSNYGVIGFAVLFVFAYLLYPIWKYRKHINPIALAGTIAIIINSLLSGSMIYPHSQIMNIVFFAWALSQVTVQPTTKPRNNYVNLLFRIAIIAIGAILINIQSANIFMTNSNSDLSLNTNSITQGNQNNMFSPYVWQFGKTEYLVYKIKQQEN